MNRIFIIFFSLILLTFSSFSFSNDANWKSYKAEGLFKKGFYYFNQRDYLLSSRYLLQALFYDTESYKIRYWLAKSYYYSGNLIQARNEFIYLLDAVSWKDLELKAEFNKYFSKIYSDPLDKSISYNFADYVLSYSLLKDGSSFNSFQNQYENSLLHPTSVHLDDFYYHYWIVGHGSNNVIVLNRNGTKVFNLISAGSKKFNQPYDIVFNQDREVYISDSGNHQIHKYKVVGFNPLELQYLYSIGGQDSLDYPVFKYPKGLDIDEKGFLYVVDSGNQQIQKLDSNGNFLFSFGSKYSLIPSSNPLRFPLDILISGSYIYISDSGNSQIQVYDLSGNWVKNIGQGLLQDPRGLKENTENQIIIADAKAGIWLFDEKTSDLKLITKDSEKFSSIVDIALGKNGFFYTLNFNKSDLDVFLLKKIKYSNLDVSIINSFQDFYEKPILVKLFDSVLDFFSDEKKDKDPIKLTHVVQVKDRFGNPVYGLDENNFKIYNNDQSISKKKISILSKRINFKKQKIIILNDQTIKMEEYKDYYQIFIERFLNILKEVDVEWINYNEKHTVSIDYTKKDFIKTISNNQNFVDSDESLGEAIHVAITRLLKSEQEIGAIFLFYSGEVSDKAFEKYSFENCLYYAKNNLIPVYIFSFKKTKPYVNRLLKLLSQKTNGDYISVYSKFHFEDILKKTIQKFPSIYYIQYGINVYSKTIYDWNTFDVHVILKDIFGKDQGGYLLKLK